MDNPAAVSAGYSPRLDPLSTSQKICTYNAPFIAIVDGDKSKIVQACCNHWDCPKCGIMRAKHEYGRIVNGAQELSRTHALYFYTFTCRGRDLSLDVAQRDYLLWTNRLLSAMRARCKKEGGTWCYVQVTERQKRGHPHSHLLMVWLPVGSEKRTDSEGKPYIYSRWFTKAHTKAGLGTQSKITAVESPIGAAKYIAKYLFKDVMFTEMPKHWKRVRYSQEFPDRPIDETSLPEFSFPLITPSDWKRAALHNVWYECSDDIIYTIASKRIQRVKRNSETST